MEEDTMDWISELPEFIVHHILSYLDSPKDLVRSSVLSKKWFALTASFPILDFNFRNFVKSSTSPSETDSDNDTRSFFKYVDYTISRCCEQNVGIHTFNLVTPLQDSTQLDVIDRWLELILNKAVKVLKVDILDVPYVPQPLPMYRMPNKLLFASSLTSLMLCNCELPSSIMVDVVNFKSLKMLHLDSVRLNEDAIKRLIIGCPLLEELIVDFCYGFKRFCVYGLQHLLLVDMCFNGELERIDIDAPNIRYLILADFEGRGAPSMNMALCNKLTTLSYTGYPSPTLNDVTDLLSNFPYLETLFLDLPDARNKLKLSSHSLRTFTLLTACDLEDIDISTPNLLLFNYKANSHNPGPLVMNSVHSKARMECCLEDSIDTLWFPKLRRFLDKKIRFKELKLCISAFSGHIDVELLKVIQSPPYELDQIDLEWDSIKDLSVHVVVVDAILWCCRPQSLTLGLNFPSTDFEDWIHIVKFTYEKLLQQEDQGRTNIQIVISSSSKSKEHFNNLNALLTSLPHYRQGERVTFIKEEGVFEEQDN
ncbi:F-box domain, Leucine-rich repeat domain, L domain-like protein [Artemisia annua]|uniref:F-box domain, Leucine-rich repeat domain, L domain-like protein n=1 Tax=Artemisia annua TaxID=35608 RepID=A0A2U1NJJ0_ARTAN|nr:F-box domain, Leucine-rich repeat domain, L domain-like protein [Artemisia annua]